MPHNRKAPAVIGNGRGSKNAIRAGSRHHSTAPIDILLNPLENVRQYGQGYRAKCPAHDGKSPGSLSIAIGDDGRILLHCFGGCSALDVVHSVGLELSDLFEKRLMHNATPAERRVLRELARQCQWKAAVPALMSESIVVLMAAGMLDKGEALSKADDARLMLAIERIESAKAVFCGR
jgi:hypothetical protein